VGALQLGSHDQVARRSLALARPAQTNRRVLCAISTKVPLAASGRPSRESAMPSPMPQHATDISLLAQHRHLLRCPGSIARMRDRRLLVSPPASALVLALSTFSGVCAVRLAALPESCWRGSLSNQCTPRTCACSALLRAHAAFCAALRLARASGVSGALEQLAQSAAAPPFPLAGSSACSSAKSAFVNTTRHARLRDTLENHTGSKSNHAIFPLEHLGSLSHQRVQWQEEPRPELPVSAPARVHAQRKISPALRVLRSSKVGASRCAPRTPGGQGGTGPCVLPPPPLVG